MIKLCNNFWDCECDKNFIHSKNQDTCPECGAVQEEQPDSRVDEVLKDNRFQVMKSYVVKAITKYDLVEFDDDNGTYTRIKTLKEKENNIIEAETEAFLPLEEAIKQAILTKSEL